MEYTFQLSRPLGFVIVECRNRLRSSCYNLKGDAIFESEAVCFEDSLPTPPGKYKEPEERENCEVERRGNKFADRRNAGCWEERAGRKCECVHRDRKQNGPSPASGSDGTQPPNEFCKELLRRTVVGWSPETMGWREVRKSSG